MIKNHETDENGGVQDVALGAYVYCTQHLRVHSTGWCSVHNRNKFPLSAQTHEEAVHEAKTKGYLTPEGDGVMFVYNRLGELVPYAEKKLIDG